MFDPGTLLQKNPWWTDRWAIRQDSQIVAWEEAKIRWIPRLGKRIEWDKDVIYVLRGPRQVGKTTLSKLKIRELLEEGVPPRAIFYWACDLVESPERLADLIEGYLTLSRNEAGRRYLFLDEITSVRDWQRGVKALYDKGSFKKSTLLLTGSHTIDLKKGSETLAGRRGEVSRLADHLPDKVLLPMKFSEYAESRSPALSSLLRDLDLLKTDRRHQIISQIAHGSLPSEVEECQLHLHTLQKTYEEYLVTGGVPKPINLHAVEGRISRDIYETYVDLLVKDIQRWGGRDRILRAVVRRAIETLGSHVSLHNLQEGTDVASHNTVASYLEYLKDAFLINSLFRLDQSSGGPLYRGERKLHFEDPFLFHAVRWWAAGLSSDPFEEALRYNREPQHAGLLSEGVVANHLARLLFSYYPSAHFDTTTLLCYSQSRAKRELDFAAKLPDGFLPIEVKYQTRIRNEDGFGILEFKKGGGSTKGILLTRSSLRKHDSYLEMPLTVFLLLA